MSIAIELPGLSETQRQIVELAREFARTKIEPFAAEWDRRAHFARDVIDELGPLAFLRTCAPEGYDGMALDSVTYLLALEERAAALAREDGRLAGDDVLGEEGEGFGYAMEGVDAGRLGIAVQAVGIARRALEHSVAYCAERRQFGRPLREFQAVQFKLADMATRIEAARALAHAVATRRDRGEDTTMQASMAKLFASEAAMWVTTQAVQLFGGYGYMRDFHVEKLFRDAKVTEI